MKKKLAIKTRIPEGGLQCKICNKSGFSTTHNLNAHLFIHKAISSRFTCNYCSKEYFRSDEYARHIATHKKNRDDNKQCYCDYCGRGFVDKRNLIQHLNIHYDLPISSTRFKCVACGADYCEQRLLNYHIRKEHLNLSGTEPVHITKNENDTWLEKVKDTKNYVEMTKVNPNKIIIKKSKVKSEKITKKITNKSIFQQYIASIYASKDNYYSKAICDYCNKEMLKKSILTHIRERHLKLRRFNCEECNRTFKRHYQLSMHKCGKRISRRHTVKVEESVGDGKKRITRRNKVKVEESGEDIQKRHALDVQKTEL